MNFKIADTHAKISPEKYMSNDRKSGYYKICTHLFVYL